MAKEIINMKDNYHPALHDRLSTEAKTPRGIVGIYDKLPNGDLRLIERQNMIVFQGREWLLQRAFGPELQGNTEIADRYIKWFGLGTGGGEAGNPLQAGATNAWDTDLSSTLRINSSGTAPSYAPRDVGGSLIPGFYKQFSSVVRKEDPANGYVVDSSTFYPELIAEIRIEIASEDGNGTDGSGYADLNEAGLFIDNPVVYSPSSSSGLIAPLNVYSISKLSTFTNETRYTFEAGTDITDVLAGDRITVTTSTNSDNDIVEALITDVGYESGGCLAYITVDNANGVDEGPDSPAVARVVTRDELNDIAMFSRVTFSTIRKTVDREIVFLWKIYF